MLAADLERRVQGPLLGEMPSLNEEVQALAQPIELRSKSRQAPKLGKDNSQGENRQGDDEVHHIPALVNKIQNSRRVHLCWHSAVYVAEFPSEGKGLRKARPR